MARRFRHRSWRRKLQTRRYRVSEAAEDPNAMSVGNKNVMPAIDNTKFRREFHGKLNSMKGPWKWIAITALVPTLAIAASWWNGDWKYRKEIGFDLSPTGADIPGTPQDVPILVRLSLGNFSYFNDTKPDGSDFRVLAGDDKTPLKFHFEKYDPQTQMALLWIRAPQITGGSKTDKIFAYYGNPDAPSAADIPGTYDPAQVLVLSFGDGTGTPADLTAYKNNPSTSTALLTPASLIGGGAKFSGKESITIPATPSLRLLPNQGFTASAWVRVEQAQQAVVFALIDQGKALSVGIDGSKFVARATLSGTPVAVTQPVDFSLSQWHHVALTAGTGKLTLYVDGVAAGSAPVALEEVGGDFSIGAANGSQFLAGDVDEVEVAKVARSPDWIKMSARGQGMDANLVVYGADGQKEGSGQTSYFVTIAKNLTVDGWVVIGICMAMLVVALVIMALKAVFLTRVERANARFLSDFYRLKDDATTLVQIKTGGTEDKSDEDPSKVALGGEGAYGTSTLFRLYYSGIYELQKRVGGQTVSAQRAQYLS